MRCFGTARVATFDAMKAEILSIGTEILLGEIEDRSGPRAANVYAEVIINSKRIAISSIRLAIRFRMINNF